MPDISTPNLDYGNMVQAWDINDALMGGTLYMRQLGETYLPRWPKEDKEDYKSARLWPRFSLPTKRRSTRMLGAYLLNPSNWARTSQISCASSQKTWDLEGTCPGCMGAVVLQPGDAVRAFPCAGGLPRVDAEQVKTKADEKATGARPYVTMLNPRQLIGWKSKMTGGKVVLTELRIKEVIIEDGDDFGQTKVEQIRLLTPGTVQIYRKATGADGREMVATRGVANIPQGHHAGHALHQAHRFYVWLAAAA